MMYHIVRILFWVALYFAFLFLTRRCKTRRKRYARISGLVVTVILFVISDLIPIENLFFSFKTLEDAYSYQSDAEIDLVVTGADSDFVIAADHMYIFPKDDSSWKLSTGLRLQRVYQSVSSDLIVQAYRYRGSEDVYIEAFEPHGEELDLQDTAGSSFQYTAEFHQGLQKEFYTYYVCAPSDVASYQITANGETCYTVWMPSQ